MTDQQELQNLQTEERLSEVMYSQLEGLYEESKQLKKEFHALLKTGKKVRNIIRKKEKENLKEIDSASKIKGSAQPEDLSGAASDIKSAERRESGLSKEEAHLLLDMLRQIKTTYKHGMDIISADKKLHEELVEIYQKDIDDFELEVTDLQKV